MMFSPRVIGTVCVLLGAVKAQYGAMEMVEGLSPRFYLGNAVQAQLARRQSGVCQSDEHSCLDVNATACCSNTEYCIIDSSFTPKCCAIGSLCSSDTDCGTAYYQCEASTTISGTATVTAACCPRSCPSVSQFKCASAYGGGCCPFGYACESGGACSATAAATSSNAAVVSEIPSGCTTSQIACPSTMGGGCCGVGLSCTVVDNTNYCASASNSATRTGPDGILASGTSGTNSSSSSGLSTGAKAGIGAGVALGACVVIGGLLWFCVVHRRHAKTRSQGESSVPALSQVSGSNATTSRPSQGGRLMSDYFTTKSGPFTEDPTSPGSLPGTNRGVPLSPHSPNDIAAAVEIGSTDHSNVTSPGFIDEYVKAPTATEHAVELP